MSPVANPAEEHAHKGALFGSLHEKHSAEPAHNKSPAPASVPASPTHAHALPAPLLAAVPAAQPRSTSDVNALHATYGNAAVARAAMSGAIAPVPKPSPPPILARPSAAQSHPSAATKAAPHAAKPHAPSVPDRKQHISPPGHAMLPHVKEAIESSLSVNLDGVEVHADSRANAAAKTYSARAFTYGNHIFLGQDEKIGDLRLVAHESAHVVQQQGVPTVHRSAPGQSDTYEREADQAASAVVRGEKYTVSERVGSPRMQRWGLSDALDYFADKANLIPGFRMFTVVLGMNPINLSPVERNAANIMRAIVEFIPGGALITEALDKYGVFDKVGAWVEKQIHTLGLIGSSIKKALDDFLDSLHWSDVLHPGDVWERAKRIFTEPIDRIKNFVVGLVDDILQFIKDAILMPLAKLAEGTRGWDLLTAVLGKNPITGEAVPRTADTLIGGFMKLIGEEEIWNNIKKANALARTWAWFQGALTGLLGFVTQIPSLFIQALKSLTITDIIVLPNAFIKVAKVFGNFVVKFITWAGNTVWTLLQIIFEVVAPAVIPYLKKVGASFKSILKNPMGFVGNLVKAGKLGFQLFVDNIGAHLKASFIEWLTGSLPGVYIPKALELKEIVKFVLSVLGLTWQNVRVKLVKVVGETAVKAMETGFDIVVTLVTEGPAAAWEKIKDMLSNLKDMVIQGIMDFIIETVVKKAVAKIISLLVPGGAFIQAIISIYDTIKVFIDKLAKIIQVVKAFLDSMMEIAAGAITGAAKKVESTLAGLLTLAISFLAGFLGLGGIAEKVMDIINTKVRAPIDKALDKVIDWIVMMAKKLFGKKEKDDRTDEQKKADLGQAIAEATALQKTPNTTEADIRKGLLPIKQKYKMESLELVVDKDDGTKETVHISGKINPDATTPPTEVPKGDVYPGPQVGPYTQMQALAGKEKLPGKKTRAAHHTPPVQLAKSLAKAMSVTADALDVDKPGAGALVREDADALAAGADKHGPGLPTILLHPDTHKGGDEGGDGVAVHQPEMAAKLRKKLGDEGINLKSVATTQEGELAVNPRGKTFERAISAVQIAQAAKHAEGPVVEEVFTAEKSRSVSAVKLALDGSKKDGSEEQKKAAVGELNNQIVDVWENQMLGNTLK